MPRQKSDLDVDTEKQLVQRISQIIALKERMAQYVEDHEAISSRVAEIESKAKEAAGLAKDQIAELTKAKNAAEVEQRRLAKILMTLDKGGPPPKPKGDTPKPKAKAKAISKGPLG